MRMIGVSFIGKTASSLSSVERNLEIDQMHILIHI